MQIALASEWKQKGENENNTGEAGLPDAEAYFFITVKISAIWFWKFLLWNTRFSLKQGCV